MTSRTDTFIDTSATGKILRWKRHPFTAHATRVSFGDMEPRLIEADGERRVLRTAQDATRFGWWWDGWTHVEIASGGQTRNQYSNPSSRGMNEIQIPWNEVGSEVQLTANGDAASAAALLLRPDPPDPAIKVTQSGSQFHVIASRNGADFPALALHLASPQGPTFAVSNAPRAHADGGSERRWQVTAVDSAFVLIVRSIAGGKIRVLACGYFNGSQLTWRHGNDGAGHQVLKALAEAAQQELNRSVRERHWTDLWPRRSGERIAHLLKSLSARFGTVIAGNGSETWVCERITGLFRLYLLGELSADIGDAIKTLEALNVADFGFALERAFPNARDFIVAHPDADERLWAARNHHHADFKLVQTEPSPPRPTHPGAVVTPAVAQFDRELKVAARLQRARMLLQRLRPGIDEVKIVEQTVEQLLDFVRGAPLDPEANVNLLTIETKAADEERRPSVHPDEKSPITKVRHDAWLVRREARAAWRRKLAGALAFCETGRENARELDAQTLRTILEDLIVPALPTPPPPGRGARLRTAAQGLLQTLDDESDKPLVDAARQHVAAKIRDAADVWVDAHAIVERATRLRADHAWLAARIDWSGGNLATRHRNANHFLELVAATAERAPRVGRGILAEWLETPNLADSAVVWRECEQLASDLEGITCVAPLERPPERRDYDAMSAEAGLRTWWDDLDAAAAAREQLRVARAAALAAIEPLLLHIRHESVAALRAAPNPSPRRYLALFLELARSRDESDGGPTP